MPARPPAMIGPRGILLVKLFGIELRADASWSLSLLVLSAFGRQAVVPDIAPDATGAGAWAIGFIFALLIAACIVIHEFAHSLIAIAHGLTVRRITLFAFGGVSQIEHEAPSPAAEFRIAVAGPLASVLLAGVTAAIARILNPNIGSLIGWWGWLSVVNTWLAIFNLVPAFPMDGGRILRSGLWAGARSRAWATRWAAVAGRAFAFLLIGLGAMSIAGGLLRREAFGDGFWALFLGVFLYNAASTAGRVEGGERPNEPPPTL